MCEYIALNAAPLNEVPLLNYSIIAQPFIYNLRHIINFFIELFMQFNLILLAFCLIEIFDLFLIILAGA